MLKMYCAVKTWMDSMKRRLLDEKGSPTLEVIVIIVIVIAVAVIFREKIMEMVNKAFTKSTTDLDTILK